VQTIVSTNEVSGYICPPYLAELKGHPIAGLKNMLINKRLSTVVLCLLGSLLISTMPTFGQANDVCADVSIEQVSQFVSAHQANWLDPLGFGREYPAGKKLTSGTPFLAYTILPENILNNTACQSDFISLLEFQGIWLVPIFLGDKPIYWLEVNCNKSLSIRGSGSGAVVEELHTLNQKLVNHDVEQSWFVQVFQTKHIFLVVKSHENDTIYPLRAFPSSYTGLETID
jgi:hypothetical protein